MRRLTLALAFLISAHAPVWVSGAELHTRVWKRALLHSAVALTSAVDCETTLYAIHHGGAELNPLMRQIVHHDNAWRGVKFSISLWNIIEAERAYRRGNPAWWQAEAIESIAGGAANAWNIRQIVIHDQQSKRKVVLP